MKRRHLKMFAGIAAIVVGLTLAISIGLTDIMLHPVKEPAGRSPDSVGLAFEKVGFASPTGATLAAWFVPNRQAHGRTVVLLHGIGASKSQNLGTARHLHDDGYNVLLVDLRNHGDSSGDITTYGYLESQDVRAVLEALSQQPARLQGGAVLMGFSMGAAIALQAIDSPYVRAVVADSPFAELESVMAYRGHLWGLPEWPIIGLCDLEMGLMGHFHVHDVSPLACVKRVHKPIFLIHGGRDRSIPVHESERLEAAAADHAQLWLVPEAGHLGASDRRPEEYYQRLNAFLQQSFGPEQVGLH